MIDPSTIRRAIADVERAVDATRIDVERSAHGRPQDDPRLRSGASALERLYAVYAHTVLNAHGVVIDLDDVCCRNCRSCAPGLCLRDRPEPSPRQTR